MTRKHQTASTAGIDAGATLWKVVRCHHDFEMRLLPAGDTNTLKKCIRIWNPDLVSVTGGGATMVMTAIHGVTIRCVPEFDAWAAGAPLLARRGGQTLPERYLLVSLGTGTSILEVGPLGGRHVGGLTLGGGTLKGLARLIGCSDSFKRLVALASRGDRRKVDLLVSDIYPNGGIPLRPTLTASSFAKLQSQRRADLAHALVGLIGETVGITSAAIAAAHEVRAIVFAGGTLIRNPVLEGILRVAATARGHEILFLSDGPFCGAVGATLWEESRFLSGQKSTTSRRFVTHGEL